MVLACVSAWEAYIEELVRQSLDAIKPPAPPLGLWVPLNATIRGQLGRFNTPNTENVRLLMSDALGLPNVNRVWAWRNCTNQQAERRLKSVLDLRHEITHGVKPRPAVSNHYATSLPLFFERLALCTDAAVRDHLATTLGVADPWPA